jgi:hypothetical protein
MDLSVRTLRDIIPSVRLFNVDEEDVFTVLNIAHLKQFERVGPYDKILYFCVYEDDPDLMGWYNKPFDRTQNILSKSGDVRTTFVVDSRISDERLTGVRYVRVDNVFEAIDQIRRRILMLVQPIVIGVTGSVGKTTTVALVESVLQKKFGCGRIYSKRLTPLTLSSWIANFLKVSHEVLALEYSMYRKNHIGALIDILRPGFGVFLNVRRMHLGVEGINTLTDIVEGKEALVRKSARAALNIDDELVRPLRRNGDFGFSLVDRSADVYVSSDGSEAVLSLNFVGQTVRFVPYIKTSLFYQQVAVAGLLGAYLGVIPESIQAALEEFKPAENRINWINVRGERVLFDGDVTVSGRMASLSEHQYASSILLIHSFNFGEENVDLQAEDFARVFATFSETRVLDTEENREIVSRYSWDVVMVTKDNLLYEFSKFEFKVLHFGIYFRKYKDLEFINQFLAD